jgi:carbonic anhydrase
VSGAQTETAGLGPQDAVDFLYAGNARFVAGQSAAPNRDIARLREVAPRQTPFAAFLGCADSRVPIEIVFDQGFGDLFVTRIAGNVAATENIASLEFATHALGVKVIYVLGHTSCGAVAAAAKAEPVPGQISPHAKRRGAIASPSMAVTATSTHGNQGDIDVALASVAAQ